jgi:uncharacterized membrane protein YccF (DUF307 family)
LAAGLSDKEGRVSTLGNVLWVIFAGIWLAAIYVVAGIFMLVLIITIPFGIQAFKLAGFALWPFGRHVVYGAKISSPLHIVGNIIWIIFGGISLAIWHLIAGVLLCVTIIGIPFGIQSFKMIPIALMPFGAEIVRDRRVPATP